MFVDASGRRSKKFRRAGWVVALACACYAATVVAALMGGNSSAPWLQIPFADKQKPGADTVQVQPSATPGASAGTTPGAPAAGPTPTDSDGATASTPSAGATTDAPGKPDPGASNSAQPPKTSTGGAGGTEPDPGTPSDPVDDPGDDPATTGGSGGEPPSEPPAQSSPPPVEESPSGDPAAHQGGQQLAAEGAH
ncbi:hypothetical protein ABZ707_17465 [Streptomyces sp. NPDC006923]|uniref:hypothetical protein n=1 Tax=Streptomyces sp. NPDC006923 TaxID=3155355 RepID=UPI0033EE2435